MRSTMPSRMPWFLLLVSWVLVAQALATHISARQDSPLLLFEGIANLQLSTCAPATFFWVYSGPDDPLSLFISNVGVPQDATTTSASSPISTDSGASSRSLHRRDNVDIQIASNISPALAGYNLTAVQVPPGVYQLVAIVASSTPYLTDSSYFTVQQGTDTSCLATSSSSPSSITPSTSTSPMPITITSSDASSASSSPIVPIAAASGASVNTGAIAGGVVAGAVVLIAATAFYCFISRKRRSGHARTPSNLLAHGPARDFGTGGPGGGVDVGRWGGLGSVDSHGPLSDPKPYGATRSSLGNGNRTSQSGSAYGGYAEEKLGSPSDEMVLTTLPYRNSTSNSPPMHNGRSHSTSSTTPSESPRRYSQSQGRRPSLEYSAQSPFATPPDTSPLSPAAISRTPSNGAQSAPRRTARKPVPAYADSPASPASPASPPTSPFPTTTPFADPATPTFPAPSVGHYQTRAERESIKSVASKKSRSSKSKLRDQERGGSNGSSANTSSEDVVRQDLAHKSSFGPGGVEGKPLHYLIPDMPIGH